MSQVMERARELVQRAADIAPVLRANTAQADRDRRLPEESVQALIDAGVFQVWTPERYGGYEADLLTHQDVVYELSRGCPSAGWVVAMATTVTWLTSLLPGDVQDEIFGADPGVRFVGLFNPSPVPARRVDGGWVVNGPWRFGTGSQMADWAMLCCPQVDDAGTPVNALLAWVPMEELSVRDDWHVLGLRGTASNTMDGTDVFVTERRVLPMLGPGGAVGGYTHQEGKESTLYRVPCGMISSPVFVAVAIGIARTATEIVMEGLPKRSLSYGGYPHQIDVASTHMQLAESATKIDTAMLHVQRGARDAWAAGEAGAIQDDVTRTRVRHDTSYAVRCCKEAMDLLMYVSGASAVSEGTHMNQLYRDMSTACLHGIARLDVTLELYGSALCGISPPRASGVY